MTRNPSKLRDWQHRSAVKAMKKKRATKRKPLKRQSDARRLAGKVYSDRRKRFLDENPVCLAQRDQCTVLAVDVHHVSGRAGKNLLDVATWLPVCRWCHSWIHQRPNKARELGLLR